MKNLTVMKANRDEEKKLDQLRDELWDKRNDLLLELIKPKADVARIQTDLETLEATAEQALPRCKLQRGNLYRNFQSAIKAIYHTLGECHEKRGAFVFAEKYLRKAVDRDNAHSYENLAEFLIARGRLKDAALVLRKTSLKVMRSEEESAAIHYLNWMFRYPSLRKHLPPSTITNWLKVLIEAAPRVALRNLTIHITTTKIDEIGA